MNIDLRKRNVSIVLGIIQHYNHNTYWRLRDIVVNPNRNYHRWIKLLFLLYIKRCDAFNCASTGADVNTGAIFESFPDLPHGIKGIIIHPRTCIGLNVTIYQHVTIGQDKGGVPKIGNNVVIGAGAIVLGNVTVGDNSIIGANAVVIRDVPANSIAVGVPAIIKQRK